MTTKKTAFAVTCRYCKTTVLQVPRIRSAEEQKLGVHLKRTHPEATFHSLSLARLLDHFIVRQVR